MDTFIFFHELNLSSDREFNRLLTAAAVSHQFRERLLSDPARAVAAGFQGERFCLKPEDIQWLVSIQPSSLAELASRYIARRSAPQHASTTPCFSIAEVIPYGEKAERIG